MNILIIAIILFLVLELMNVATLYFKPDSKAGNGIGVFNAWEKSKEIPEVHELVKYLTYWVAGTKLIFIGLLLVIILTANEVTQFYAVGVLILSIFSFYWRLYPMIKKMDAQNHITPKGYSKTLGMMITVIIIVLSAVLFISML
ncbi:MULTISPECIES: hypothetical protein [unclassified Fusibacter]|uniref:hypothetical protein n=1 Tax=unclassified Fusibacter TaxID=2624464 RepID=UPI0010104EFD|nr:MULTISPECIES: hypothetical protein [unclassified Fusibacter]MCK8060809.1 hypothetical protein [Fusibacter sp. A2]NPE23105.1 hypothetical protein [Fusibacter sp. A1]RXV59776.1 hypothetical protein DWB64_14830 [Fusibacter sp. A1]